MSLEESVRLSRELAQAVLDVLGGRSHQCESDCMDWRACERSIASYLRAAIDAQPKLKKYVCPACKNYREFTRGPEGGLSINIQCVKCGNRWNDMPGLPLEWIGHRDTAKLAERAQAAQQKGGDASESGMGSLPSVRDISSEGIDMPAEHGNPAVPVASAPSDSTSGGAPQPGVHCLRCDPARRWNSWTQTWDEGCPGLPQPPATPPERPSSLWGYGCTDHPGDPSAMGGGPGVCLATPKSGTKGAQRGSQICGRKLEALVLDAQAASDASTIKLANFDKDALVKEIRRSERLTAKDMAVTVGPVREKKNKEDNDGGE